MTRPLHPPKSNGCSRPFGSLLGNSFGRERGVWTAGGGGRMALDIYVMSLWRFKVGDFCSPIEAAMGVRPRIVTTEGIEDRPVSVGWLDRWRARRQVVAIRKSVGAVNKTRVQWHDEGGVVYS